MSLYIFEQYHAFRILPMLEKRREIRHLSIVLGQKLKRYHDGISHLLTFLQHRQYLICVIPFIF